MADLIKNNYISKEEFDIYRLSNRLYEGFVEGVGYAWFESQVATRNTSNGIYPQKGTPHNFSDLSIVYAQMIDTSERMVRLSLRKKFPKGYSIYIVETGDTLSQIADKHNASIQELIRWNDISDPNLIHPGRILHIDNAKKHDENLKENELILKAFSGNIESRFQGEIRQYKPNLFGAIEESIEESWFLPRLVGGIIYGTADDIWITLQCFTIGHASAHHLSGRGLIGSEATDAGISALTVLTPIGKIGKSAKVLNAAIYNFLHKGTGITAAKKGGHFIRQHNHAARELRSFHKLYPWINLTQATVPHMVKKDTIR